MSNRPVENNDILNDPSVLNLDRVVFIGRTFSEYMAMFNLHPFQLKGLRVLDCPSGTSSFVAEALSSQYQLKEVIGCDLLYREDDVEVLKNRGKVDLDYMIKQLSQVPDLYDWKIYSSISDLYEARNNAFKRFISDYKLDRLMVRKGEITTNRYIQAILPKLPFGNATFDLVLNSNLLFYYHNIFDYHFHLDSILELLRVTRKEVRIFPCQKPDATFPDYFNKLLDNINTRMNNKISFQIEKVSHEFRRGINKMLKINKKE
jgi:SAM-dependent methyltransferase